jgi:hypothetical protein
MSILSYLGIKFLFLGSHSVSSGLNKGPVWFSFLLTSFSENLTVGRIWLCRESKYH